MAIQAQLNMNILQKLKFTERKEVAQGNSCSKARIKTDKILPPHTLKKHIIHPCLTQVRNYYMLRYYTDLHGDKNSNMKESEKR